MTARQPTCDCAEGYWQGRCISCGAEDEPVRIQLGLGLKLVVWSVIVAGGALGWWLAWLVLP